MVKINTPLPPVKQVMLFSTSKNWNSILTISMPMYYINLYTYIDKCALYMLNGLIYLQTTRTVNELFSINFRAQNKI